MCERERERSRGEYGVESRNTNRIANRVNSVRKAVGSKADIKINIRADRSVNQGESRERFLLFSRKTMSCDNED